MIKKITGLFLIAAFVCAQPTLSAADVLRPAALDERRAPAGENYFNRLSHTQRVIVALYAIKNFYVGSYVDVMAIGKARLNVLSQAEIDLTYELERRLPAGFREEVYNILAGVMLKKITGAEVVKMLRIYSPLVAALGNEAIVKEVVSGLHSLSDSKPRQPARQTAENSPTMIFLISENSHNRTLLKMAIGRSRKHFVILEDDLDTAIGYLQSGSVEGQHIGTVVFDLHAIKDADKFQRAVNAARAGNVDVYVLFRSEQTLFMFQDIIKKLGRGHSIQEIDNEKAAALANRIVNILTLSAPEPNRPSRETDAAV